MGVAGSSEHNKARDQLQKVWSFLENNQDTCGMTLLRAMFRAEPAQIERFPFFSDEWTKIAYADYTGQFGEQPPATWFVLFRFAIISFVNIFQLKRSEKFYIIKSYQIKSEK